VEFKPSTPDRLRPFPEHDRSPTLFRMNTPVIHTYFLPSLLPDEPLGETAVVIDVLRATTTAAAALHHGAAGIVPVETIEEARALAKTLSPPPLLGGERGGLPIEGFDLGNSPAAYDERVRGRWIVFTTTNGTRAIHACRTARQVVLAAFANLSAITDWLAARRQVALVCSGTDGQITLEDVLCAGALLDLWSDGDPSSWQLDDASRLAHDAWQAHARHWTGQTWLVDQLRLSRGGRNLTGLGQTADIELAAQIDQYPVIPRWHWPENRIVLDV